MSQLILRNKKGFTLAEIAITVVIIGVLASLAIPRMSFVIEKSKLSEGANIVSALLNAQIAHFYEKGVYATTVAALDVTIPASNNFNAPVDADITETDTSLVTITRTGGTYKLIGGLDPASNNETLFSCDDTFVGATAGICKKLGM